ncbi:putative leader peptide [Streptomyces glaucosporus]|uniref:putative leader peptide n=1 Tax=Streptomyces glaucosporus TaxID=284044 RepID=UPI003CD07140
MPLPDLRNGESRLDRPIRPRIASLPMQTPLRFSSRFTRRRAVDLKRVAAAMCR